MANTLILGGGVTGLAVGAASGCPVFEAEDRPGGICSSYYMVPGSARRLPEPPPAEGAFRFELGGGHWIFGGDHEVLRLVERLSPLRRYERRSAVYFAATGTKVPYPIQNHLRYLDKSIADRALEEVLSKSDSGSTTMQEWMASHFGPTLCELFFDPFHERYTAGLCGSITPQDGFKSPMDPKRVLQGARAATESTGYNVTFAYPERGLDRLTGELAAASDVRYGKRAVSIDASHRRVRFSDGTTESYRRLVSTLPLSVTAQMADAAIDELAAPHTCVLVVNIGAQRGSDCPDEHWLYLPDSRTGFHRIGFYSNVDVDFVPDRRNDLVSIYVEFAFRPEDRPRESEIQRLCDETVVELRDLGFIGESMVVDPTWIDVGYTWSWPGSSWQERQLVELERLDIIPVGRYARWKFQGIADSIRDGLVAGAALRVTG